MPQHRILAAAVASVALLGAKPADAPKLKPPAYLPAAARELLVDRMKDHRADMSALTFAVVLLDKANAERLARAIAQSPRIARPTDAPDELNSLLPPRFFELQDQLRRRAEDLATAAKSGDDAAMAKAYGALSETCVACHATYLNPNR